MQLTKYRAFGKSRFIQMAVSLLSMLIYWGFSSGIFEILFNYNESSLIIMPKRQNRYVTICWRAVCI